MTVPESNNKKDFNSPYRMSVHISLTGLSFLVETENKTVFEEEIVFSEPKNPDELLFEIDKAFAEMKPLQNPVFELTLIYQNPFYSIVPATLFKEEEADKYLQLNTRIFTSDFVAFDTLENFELINVYVPLANINNYFFDRYGEFSYYHFATTLLEKTLQNEKTGNPKKMYAHLHGQQVDVVITFGKKLLLCNSFNYTTPEDLTYYILFTAEQLQLNPETFELELSGKISKSNPHFELLYTYIRNVTVQTKNPPSLQIK